MSGLDALMTAMLQQEVVKLANALLRAVEEMKNLNLRVNALEKALLEAGIHLESL